MVGGEGFEPPNPLRKRGYNPPRLATSLPFQRIKYFIFTHTVNRGVSEMNDMWMKIIAYSLITAPFIGVFIILGIVWVSTPSE